MFISLDLSGSFSVFPTGENFKAVLLRMSQLASSGATELRVRSLAAISHLLTLQVQHVDARLTSIHYHISFLCL